ncbi:hypothetical protein ACFLYH_02465 [Candidatus Dependentiae bacterium]
MNKKIFVLNFLFAINLVFVSLFSMGASQKYCDKKLIESTNKIKRETGINLFCKREEQKEFYNTKKLTFEEFQYEIESLGCKIINKIPCYKILDVYNNSITSIIVNTEVANKFVNNLKSFFNKNFFEHLLNKKYLYLKNLNNCADCLKTKYIEFTYFWNHDFIKYIVLPRLLIFFNQNFIIKELNLSNNGLDQLPYQIKFIEDLEYLYAEENLLIYFPSWLWELQELKFFSFSMNKKKRSLKDKENYIRIWKEQNKKLLVYYYVFDIEKKEWIDEFEYKKQINKKYKK